MLLSLDALRTMMQGTALRPGKQRKYGRKSAGVTRWGPLELHLTEPKAVEAICCGYVVHAGGCQCCRSGMADDACAKFGANQLAASLAPIPEGLSTAQLQALQQTSPPPEPGISKTQQMLAQLYT